MNDLSTWLTEERITAMWGVAVALLINAVLCCSATLLCSGCSRDEPVAAGAPVHGVDDAPG